MSEVHIYLASGNDFEHIKVRASFDTVTRNIEEATRRGGLLYLPSDGDRRAVNTAHIEVIREIEP